MGRNILFPHILQGVLHDLVPVITEQRTGGPLLAVIVPGGITVIYGKDEAPHERPADLARPASHGQVHLCPVPPAEALSRINGEVLKITAEHIIRRNVSLDK